MLALAKLTRLVNAILVLIHVNNKTEAMTLEGFIAFNYFFNLSVEYLVEFNLPAPMNQAGIA